MCLEMRQEGENGGRREGGEAYKRVLLQAVEEKV